MAAAAGGFAGFGIGTQTYESERGNGHSDADLIAMLAAYGVVVSELDAPFALTGPGEVGRLKPTMSHILHVAEVFDVQQIYVIGSPGYSTGELAASLGWICDCFRGQGARIGIEYMSLPEISGLPTLKTALEVVNAAGRANGGVLIDSYHHLNGDNDWTELERLPGDLVAGIQLSDCTVPRRSSDYFEDTMHNRQVPGEGDADLIRFVKVFDAIGASCPYSLEVINDGLASLAPSSLGERLGSASRRLLGAARKGACDQKGDHTGRV